MGRKRYKVGDPVRWRDARGELVEGRVEKVAVSAGHTQRGRFEATKKDPAVIVRVPATNDRVAIPSSALRMLEKEAGWG